MAERFLAGARVGDVRESIVRKAATIGSQSSVPELLEKILEDPRSRHVFVVDEGGVLTGSVRLNSVIRHLFPYVTGTGLGGTPRATDLLGRLPTGSVADIMTKTPRFVTDESSIVGTVRLMEEEQINELPVVDEKRRVVGEVNFLEIIAECLKRRRRLFGPDTASPGPGRNVDRT